MQPQRMPNLHPQYGPPPSKLALALHGEECKKARKNINAGRIRTDGATGFAVGSGLVGNRLWRRRVGALARSRRLCWEPKWAK